MVTVWNWFRKRPSVPLAGAPAHLREKTYSAASGYVYQYFYQGRRQVDSGAEYVFSVSADRKTSFPVTVFLRDGVVDSWIRDHDRELNETERYAVSKAALKLAMDERSHPGDLHDLVAPSAAEFAALCETLDLP